jgi:hypothetical protein
MAKATLPQRLIRDIERTLQDRINEVKNKIAEHYAQCRAEIAEIAETFGIEKDELFTLAGVPLPEEKTRRQPKKVAKKKKVVKKKAVAPKKKAVKKGAAKKATKKRSGGTAEEKVAAFLKKTPTASGSAISKATGYADKTVYGTKAWQKRTQ